MIKENKPTVFRPLKSRVAIFYAGESSDTSVLRLNRSQLPIQGVKPSSYEEGVGLNDTGEKVFKWGKEKINIDNY